MSFHLGDRVSYRWTVDASGVHVAMLPPAWELNSLASRFHDAVESDDPAAISMGQQLYSTLFAGIGSAARRPHWILALSGRLFEIPFGALVTAIDRGAPKYLIQYHTLTTVPGVWAVGSQNAPQDGTLLALGDPIYNRADPRLKVQGGAGISFSADIVHSLWNRGPATTPEMPRLVGSGHEVQECARQWNGPFQVLTGTEVTRSKLEQALRQRPAAIHIAGHFVVAPEKPDSTMIALSMQTAHGLRSTSLELVTSADVSTFQVPGSLVVLSGCSSALGRSVPGAGLLSLTRAWLSAGATNVIASLWPTPDDSGELFASFYSNLRNPVAATAPSPAEALRAAQLKMLHSPTWRSAPRYWAAYQLTARSNTQ